MYAINFCIDVPFVSFHAGMKLFPHHLIMSGVASSALDVALALALRPEILGIMSSMLLFMVTMFATWFILRSTYVAYSDAFAPYETVIFLRMETLGGSLVLLGLAVPRSIIEAARSFFDIVTSDIIKIITAVILGIAALAFLLVIPEVASAGLKLRITTIMPIFEELPFRLLNLGRLIYGLAVPISNVVHEIQKFLLTGYQKVLVGCTSGDDIFIVIKAAALAVAELARALGQWVSGGVLTARLDLVTFFYQIGLAANAAGGPLTCFCSVFSDLIELVVGIPQIDELHSGLSATANIAVRAFQMIMRSLLDSLADPLNPTPPDFSLTAVEVITAETMLLEFVRIVILHVVEFLVALLDTIGIIIPTEYDTVLKLSLNMVESDGGPPRPTPGRVTLADMLHATMRTTASPLRVGAQSPIWDLPENSTLSDLLGVRRILLLLSTRWSYIVSKPVAAGVSIANGTLNMIGNSFTLFDTPDGLAYFQFGVPFDYLREALGAVANLGIVLDENLAPATKGTTDGILFYVEAVFEIFFGFLFAIIFPRWLPGLDPPTNCSVQGTCSYPAPAGWTAFNYFPRYYDWEQNAIRQSLETFEENADNIAVLLGCDNTSVAIDNCTDLPFQCAVRTSNLLLTEWVNQSNLFVFYLPDLVRFDSSLHTFQNLSPAVIIDRLNLFVSCLTHWYLLFYLTQKTSGGSLFNTITCVSNHLLHKVDKLLKPFFLGFHDHIHCQQLPLQLGYACPETRIFFLHCTRKYLFTRENTLHRLH